MGPEIAEDAYEAMPVPWSEKIRRDDEAAIGTADYQGVGWFWHHVYRYPLRDATFAQRREVHRRLLEADVPPVGFGSVHDRAIEDVTGIAPTVDEVERAKWLDHHLIRGRA